MSARYEYETDACSIFFCPPRGLLCCGTTLIDRVAGLSKFELTDSDAVQVMKHRWHPV